MQANCGGSANRLYRMLETSIELFRKQLILNIIIQLQPRVIVASRRLSSGSVLNFSHLCCREVLNFEYNGNY